MVKKYSVKLLPKAIDDLKRIDKFIAQRIINKIKWLSENFENIIPENLDGEFKNMYKLRIGDWRVIFTIDRQTKTIYIHLIGHRRDIYKI